jgi:A/G-specific adenine glycosylase
MNFARAILNWYMVNKRDLPWRNTNDPYSVWLSEIILQQTRITQGLPYYLKFISKYPTINSLARANENDILILWQGLGYYSRARNLLKTAKFIVDECNGKFPSTYTELIKLKGIGEYTASAISSICFNERRAVLDGNVYRVLSRFYGIDVPVNNHFGKKFYMDYAQKLAPKKSCGDYNQGIMDFGSLMCKPKAPLCDKCILEKDCIASKMKNINYFPVKLKKNAPKITHFNYLVLLDSDHMIWMNKIKNGIWKNLFQFPMIESKKELNKIQVLSNEIFKSIVPISNSDIILFNSSPIIHKLSHKTIYAKFWILPVEHSNSNSIKFSDVNKYPVPRLIEKFLDKFNYKHF